MNQKNMLADRSESLSLLPLRTVLKEAKLYASPNSLPPPADMDEQLASRLIENVKKQYRRPSPFAIWIGQPFPHEYKEMVAADVR